MTATPTSTPETDLIARMFEAFAAQDLEAAVATVTDDSVWIHHGTRKLPSVRFEGREGVRTFFRVNFTAFAVEYFRPLETLQAGDKVIVFGEEKFVAPGESEPWAQRWIQVYTVRDGLIARMEEFATSALADEYDVVTDSQ